MTQKAETNFKDHIRPLLEALPHSWWVKIQQVSIRGTPDILGCVSGHFVALELKATPEDQPDALQNWNLDKITRAGGLALTVHPGNWDNCYRILIDIALGRVVCKPEPVPAEGRKFDA